MTFRFRPIVNAVVTSPFGERDLDDDGENEQHNGTDYGAPVGTPLFAMGDGIVDRADDVDDSANGKNVVIIDDTDGRVTYLHMASIARNVVGGARVRAGQFIGRVGMTGATRGPHLHLQWQPNFPRSTRPADIDPVVQLLPAPPTTESADDEDGGIGSVLFTVFLLWAGWHGYLALKRKRST